MTEHQPYSLRRTRLSDEADTQDFVIRWNGRDVGRVYRGKFAQRDLWQWTIYMIDGARRIEGVPIQGLAETLDEAKAEFRSSFDRMRAAGAGPQK